MCHDPDSRPPIYDAPLTSATGADLLLTAHDGTTFGAFQAHPGEASGVGVVVLPDVRGLHDFYRDLALRFAEVGHAALVIDYYGRSAGPEPRPSGVGFEDVGFDFMEHAGKLEMSGLEDDFTTAVSHLRASTGCSSVFTIGFCMGGRQSYLSSARGLDLAGCIGFYGSLGSRNGVDLMEHVPSMNAPILALQSKADEEANPEHFQHGAFDAALTAAGVAHELVVYDAPHSFFDVKYAEHADTCADAWSRTKAFIAQYS